jgi:Zn-dependent peptidase ImmA (M78 family)
VPIDQQIEWGSETEALRNWRSSLERIGVFVFFFPMGETSSQGFSIWDEYAPVIAINTWWNNPTSRIFTLFHEYGHLLTRTNSACIGHMRHWNVETSDHVERWCEKFAASFLMPWNAVTAFLEDHLHVPSGEKITDLEIPKRVASYFKVSLRAATLRLIEKNRADWNLYREIEPVSDRRRGGGGGQEGRHRGVIKVEQYGMRTAETIVKGVKRNLIGHSDAIRLMDIPHSYMGTLERTFEEA